MIIIVGMNYIVLNYDTIKPNPKVIHNDAHKLSFNYPEPKAS